MYWVPASHTPRGLFYFGGEMRHVIAALFGASVLSIVCAPNALAADMAAPAPMYSKAPVAMTAYSWTGFYVGGTVGGASTKTNVSLNTVNGPTPLYAAGDIPGLNAIGSPSITDSNAIFGGKIGYNQQFNSIVLGLEADISAFRFNKTAFTTGSPFAFFPAGFANFTTNVSTNWLTTIRPRIGYAYDRALFYGTAGVAFGKVNFSNTYFGLSPGGFGNENETSAGSQTRVGWAAGAGVDYALTKNWIVSGEYQHVDLGKISASGLVTTGVPVAAPTAIMNFSTKLTSDIVRAGVTYKF
jgi:outer membrane immunogenic protein